MRKLYASDVDLLSDFVNAGAQAFIPGDGTFYRLNVNLIFGETARHLGVHQGAVEVTLALSTRTESFIVPENQIDIYYLHYRLSGRLSGEYNRIRNFTRTMASVIGYITERPVIDNDIPNWPPQWYDQLYTLKENIITILSTRNNHRRRCEADIATMEPGRLENETEILAGIIAFNVEMNKNRR